MTWLAIWAGMGVAFVLGWIVCAEIHRRKKGIQ